MSETTNGGVRGASRVALLIAGALAVTALAGVSLAMAGTQLHGATGQGDAKVRLRWRLDTAWLAA